ncbi:hypothetical protein [Lewinella sp. IMCC34183]|uniref:hypothetical protein n=1 Tax=Lewinella sp. IMCC34183 TaxID=2248762 RepID=UPI000E2623F8|nr:hypothetical protein [Lewinella sp. IMCC34183]
METKLFDYDPARYPFRSLISRYIGTDDLEDLRAAYTSDPELANSLYKNMEQSPVFKAMYAGLRSAEGEEFYAVYECFIREVIRPQFTEPIYYQTKPSHRILFADVPGQSRFHRDADYGHDPAEINYWVALTPAYATNTFWIESEEGKEDYQPVETRPGQYARFRGSTLSHGAKNNTTGKSRVSFDFRVIPAADAPARYREQAAADANAANPVQANALKFSYCE